MVYRTITFMKILLLVLLLYPMGSNVIEVYNPPAVVTEVTGYSSEVGQTDSTPHLTAAQTKVRDGVIACPRYIKFFTKVEVNGKEYICEDRMNIRHKDRFDIWFPSTQEALQFGIKTLTVIIHE